MKYPDWYDLGSVMAYIYDFRGNNEMMIGSYYEDKFKGGWRWADVLNNVDGICDTEAEAICIIESIDWRSFLSEEEDDEL